LYPVFKSFNLIFENKLKTFRLSHVIAYIQHYSLLQYNIDESELQVSAFFGKISAVLAASPYVTFHLIIELQVAKDELEKIFNH
jgi:hypothetical protein